MTEAILKGYNNSSLTLATKGEGAKTNSINRKIQLSWLTAHATLDENELDRFRETSVNRVDANPVVFSYVFQYGNLEINLYYNSYTSRIDCSGILIPSMEEDDRVEFSFETDPISIADFIKGLESSDLVHSGRSSK